MPLSTNKQLQRKKCLAVSKQFPVGSVTAQERDGGDLKRGGKMQRKIKLQMKRRGTRGNRNGTGGFWRRGGVALKLFAHCLRNHQVVGRKGMVSALSKHRRIYLKT